MPPRTKHTANRHFGQSRKRKEKIINEGPQDISSQFGASFPIFSEEEGKKFQILKGRRIVVPRFFEFEVLEKLGIKNKIENLSARVGWNEFIKCNLVTYKELTLEFYTTLTFDSKNIESLTFRLGGQKRQVNHDIMNEIFGLPKGGVHESHKNFDVSKFWGKMTNEKEKFNAHNAPNGLIHDVGYLLLHKFISHAIFGKQEGNKCSRKELFLLWCLSTKTKVSTTYHIFHSLVKIATQHNTTIGLGFIVTGFASYFGLDFSGLTPLTVETFHMDYLRRSEIIDTQRVILRDPGTRSCVKFRNCQEPCRLTPVNLSECSSESDDASDDEEGWQQVLQKIEESNQRQEERMTQMNAKLEQIARQQRYNTKKMIKFFEVSGVQVPSPTPSPPESPSH